MQSQQLWGCLCVLVVQHGCSPGDQGQQACSGNGSCWRGGRKEEQRSYRSPCRPPRHHQEGGQSQGSRCLQTCVLPCFINSSGPVVMAKMMEGRCLLLSKQAWLNHAKGACVRCGEACKIVQGRKHDQYVHAAAHCTQRTPGRFYMASASETVHAGNCIARLHQPWALPGQMPEQDGADATISSLQKRWRLSIVSCISSTSLHMRLTSAYLVQDHGSSHSRPQGFIASCHSRAHRQPVCTHMPLSALSGQPQKPDQNRRSHGWQR